MATDSRLPGQFSGVGRAGSSSWPRRLGFQGTERESRLTPDGRLENTRHLPVGPDQSLQEPNSSQETALGLTGPGLVRTELSDEGSLFRAKERVEEDDDGVKSPERAHIQKLPVHGRALVRTVSPFSKLPSRPDW